MGSGRVDSELFAGLVRGVSRGGNTEGALGRGGWTLARVVREAPLEADDRRAAGVAATTDAVPAGISDQRRPATGVPAIAGVWADAVFSRSRVWGRHGGKEAASGAAAAGIRKDEAATGGMRVRWRYAGRSGDGASGRNASDCDRGYVPDGEEFAGRKTGVFVGGIGRVAQVARAVVSEFEETEKVKFVARGQDSSLRSEWRFIFQKGAAIEDWAGQGLGFEGGGVAAGLVLGDGGDAGAGGVCGDDGLAGAAGTVTVE